MFQIQDVSQPKNRFLVQHVRSQDHYCPAQIHLEGHFLALDPSVDLTLDPSLVLAPALDLALSPVLAPALDLAVSRSRSNSSSRSRSTQVKIR